MKLAILLLAPCCFGGIISQFQDYNGPDVEIRATGVTNASQSVQMTGSQIFIDGSVGNGLGKVIPFSIEFPVIAFHGTLNRATLIIPFGSSLGVSIIDVKPINQNLPFTGASIGGFKSAVTANGFPGGFASVSIPLLNFQQGSTITGNILFQLSDGDVNAFGQVNAITTFQGIATLDLDTRMELRLFYDETPMVHNPEPATMGLMGSVLLVLILRKHLVNQYIPAKRHSAADRIENRALFLDRRKRVGF